MGRFFDGDGRADPGLVQVQAKISIPDRQKHTPNVLRGESLSWTF